MNQEKLEMTRGDTLKLKFSRQTENQEVIFEKADEMYMTFKKSIYSEKILFQKSLKDGTITYDSETGYYHVIIEPADTEGLRYGDYVFDIEIKKGNTVKTIVKGTLKLTEEVTFSCNRGVK